MGIPRSTGDGVRRPERQLHDEEAQGVRPEDIGDPERLVPPDQPALGEKTLKKLYVGNLPFTATDDEISTLFGQHGSVHSVALINDRETGRPRGFGFVEVDDDAVQTMIQALDGKELGGRTLRVNEAQDRPRNSGGSRGGDRW